MEMIDAFFAEWAALGDGVSRFARLPGDAAGLLLIALALGLEALIGWAGVLRGWRVHPRRWIDPVAGAVAAEARAGAGPWRGVFWLVFAALLAGVSGYALALVARLAPWAWLLELFLLFAFLRLTGPLAQLRAVRRRLHEGPAVAARPLAGFVTRELGRADDHGVGRAAVERAARAFAEDGVGALFWYGLGGLPGLFIYVAIARLNERAGFRAGGYEQAAFAIRRTAAALNFIPARLAGLILGLATAFVPGGRPGAALAALPRHARKHRNQAAGWPQAALAGAFDLALGGPRLYAVEAVDEGWIGDGRARLRPVDLGRCVWALGVAGLLTGLLALSLAFLRAV